MKRYPTVVAVLILLVFGATASQSAIARGGGRGGSGHGGAGHGGGYSHGGGYGHGYGYRGSVGVGISLGVPLYGLGYYPAPYYSYPAYAYPAPAYSYPGQALAPAGGYVEQGYAQAAPAPHSKTGTTARVPMPITPMSGSVPVVGSASPRNRNADRL